MQMPVDIAFRQCEPSEEIRSEIAAQAQRLEKFSPRITSCHVVVNGPQTRNRNGDLFHVQLRIAMPGHKDVVVDRRHGDAPEREHPRGLGRTGASAGDMHQGDCLVRRSVEGHYRLRRGLQQHPTVFLLEVLARLGRQFYVSVLPGTDDQQVAALFKDVLRLRPRDDMRRPV